MTETDFLKAHILKRIEMPIDDLEKFVGAFKLKKVKKKQLIIQPEFTAQQRFFIVKGAFRSYVIGQDSTDHTIQFAIEDWWIGDINSYIYQKPATLFVEALEDSIVLQIDYHSEQKLKAANHSIETFFRIVSERTAAFHQRRIITSLTQTAEERYDNFMESYSIVVQRLPLYILASYLGMTRQFLSKIRNSRVKKQ
jgi:CRP-like cAMP-binding protein